MSLTMNPVNWSPNTKKNVATAGTIAATFIGAKAINNVAKGKSYVWNNNINKILKNFAKSKKDFFGATGLKDIAGKLSKTSGRQKMLGGFLLGAIGAGVAIREHFAKKQVADAKQAEFDKEIKNYDSLINLQSKKIDELNNAIDYKDSQIENRDACINKQNKKITDLEAEIMIKDSDIKGFNKTIEVVEKAAENLGVDKALADEMEKIS